MINAGEPQTMTIIDSDEDTTENVPQLPQLSAIELRVIGVLMEKQLTTPEQYPLTVNSILTGSNQKTSRDPVTSYQQGEITRALNALGDRRFVRKEFGSRADKYSQQFMHHLELSKKHQAVLCLMMLRGPQSFSELSTRTQRMGLFSDKDDLLHCVERLCERALPCVVRLGHQPGQRGERFAHLFSGTPVADHGRSTAGVIDRPASTDADNRESLPLLESEIGDLNEAIQELKAENRVLRHQLERLYELTGHPVPG